MTLELLLSVWIEVLKARLPRRAPQHTKRLGTVLRRLHSGRVDGDFAQVHFFTERGFSNCFRP